MNPKHPVLQAKLAGYELIEASAGTGKTWTLSAILLRAMLERDWRIEQIAVITFTRAAAAELKERILARLQLAERCVNEYLVHHDWPADLSGDPFLAAWLPSFSDTELSSHAKRLRLALLNRDQLQCSTIHAWAASLLKQGFGPEELFDGIELIMSDSQLMREVEESFLAQLANPGAPNSLAMLTPAQHAWFATWLQNNLLGSFTPNSRGLNKGRPLKQFDAALAHPHVPATLRQESLSGIVAQIHTHLEKFLSLSEKDWCDWVDFTSNHPKTKKSSFTKNITARIKDNFVRIRTSLALSTSRYDQFSNDLDRLLWRWEAMGLNPNERPDHPACRAIEACDQARRLLDKLPMAIAFEFRQFALPELARLKESQRVCTQDDLIRRIHQVLLSAEHPERAAALRKELRQRYPMVLLDECQDTDQLSWEVLLSTYAGFPSEACSLIAVGDPKQAIYRFRGADVHAYLNARDSTTFAVGGMSIQFGAPTKFQLTENQRSTPELLEIVNRLFEREGGFVSEGIDYAPVTKGLRPIERLREPAFLLNWVSAQQAPKNADFEQIQRTWLIKTVKHLLAQTWSASTQVRPGDIAILVRSNREATRIRQWLNRNGIPAVETTQAKVTESDEAQELLIWLDALANLDQRGYLLSALGTCLWGAQMPEIRALGADLVQLETVRQQWQQALAEWQRARPLLALQQLIEQAGTIKRLTTLADAGRRIANLNHLLELVGRFCAAMSHPHQAAQWLRELMDDSESVAEPELLELRLESDANLVRIMTIHKSKGLEFPIVLLPDFADKERPALPDKQPFFSHRPDGQANSKPGSQMVFEQPWSESIKEEASKEQLAEQTRLLYVALTRARSHVFGLWYAEEARSQTILERLVAKQAGKKSAKEAAKEAGTEGPQHNSADKSSTHRNFTGFFEQLKAAGVTVQTLDAQELDAQELYKAKPEHPLPPVQSEPIISSANPAEPSAAEELLPPALPVHSAWVTTSFTALADRMSERQIAEADDSGRDHDRHALQTAAQIDFSNSQSQQFQPIHPAAALLPSDASTGLWVHHVFELAADWSRITPADLELAAKQCGFTVPVDHMQGLSLEELSEWFNLALAQPIHLGEGAGASVIRLNQVQTSHMRREQPFFMSLRSDLNPKHWAQALQFWGIEPKRAESYFLRGDRPLLGFFKGVIDLIFVQGGRCYILDWKTHRLGASLQAFTADSLKAVIQQDQYDLQAACYSLALHRWLKQELGTAYQPTLHFGGVIYLFIRGRGAKEFSSDDSTLQAGVYSWQPTREALEALDQCFGARYES